VSKNSSALLVATVLSPTFANAHSQHLNLLSLPAKSLVSDQSSPMRTALPAVALSGIFKSWRRRMFIANNIGVENVAVRQSLMRKSVNIAPDLVHDQLRAKPRKAVTCIMTMGPRNLRILESFKVMRRIQLQIDLMMDPLVVIQPKKSHKSMISSITSPSSGIKGLPQLNSSNVNMLATILAALMLASLIHYLTWITWLKVVDFHLEVLFHTTIYGLANLK
jgi:hypothetical protein